jgi:hypothetical protein
MAINYSRKREGGNKYVDPASSKSSFLDNLTGQSTSLTDNQILIMLRGMTPAKFEQEMARMFTALGYWTEVVGGVNDGGIDIVAYKDGKKYFIQCKKFIIREATPHDVRDFLGAITNFNDPAEKGFFITTNKFTVLAEKTAEGNPKIELIDAPKLIQYYIKAYGTALKIMPIAPTAIENSGTKMCPRCGETLTLRTAQKGERSGKQFWGCSNFPKCKYIENIQEGETIPGKTTAAEVVQSDKNKCTRCGGNLTLRTAKKGEHANKQFWGCSNYPKCKYIENI